MKNTSKVLPAIDLFDTAFIAGIFFLPFSLRLSSISMVAIAVMWLWKLARGGITRPDPWLLVLFLSFYLLHGVGLLWSENMGHGLFELERKAGLFLFPLVSLTMPERMIRIRNRAIWAFVAACALAGMFFLFYAAYRALSSHSFSVMDPQTNQVTHFFVYEGLSSVLIQPMYFSLYIGFCVVFLLIGLAGDMKSRSFGKPQFVKVLLLLFFIVLMVLLAVRITIIGLVVILVVGGFWILVKEKASLRTIIFLFISAVATVVFSLRTPIVRDRFQELFNSSYTFKNDPLTNGQLAGKLDGVNMRLAKWYFTIEAGKDHPWLGVGSGDDEDALLSTYRKNNFAEGYIPKFNSHNQYLQTWLGLGIVGVVSLLALLVVPFATAVRNGDMLLFGFSILVGLFCVTESMLCRQWGVVFFSFFNSMLLFPKRN